EPATAQANVLILGDGEFPLRLADIPPVEVDVVREIAGRAHPPALRLQHLPISLFISAQCQLEGLCCSAPQVEGLKKLEMLAPVVDFAIEAHAAAGLPPVADRCPHHAGLLNLRLPEIDEDWLPRGPEVKAVGHRHFAVGLAEVPTEGKERTVRGEEIDGRLPV